jgi:hypothetical protein
MTRNAAAGALVWLVVAVMGLAGRGPFWIIEVLFLLAPLVLVPLALGRLELDLGRLRLAQLPAALTATAAFLLPRGALSAGLAAAWLAFTLLLGTRGLRRLQRPGLSDAAEVAITAALLFLPVGGGWLVVSRLGLTPLGFEEPIVLLTAVHFHHAAFTAPVLAGLTLRALRPSLPRRLLVAGVISGTPILALGITASRSLELLGTVILAASLGGLAVVLLSRFVPGASTALAKGLFAVAALSSLLAMTFALAYAWGQFGGRPLVSLSQMARFHGPANALGFGLCGLLGFTLDRRGRR